MTLTEKLKEAAQAAVGDALADIVTKEVYRAVHEHEEQLTILVRAAVTSALEEMFK